MTGFPSHSLALIALLFLVGGTAQLKGQKCKQWDGWVAELSSDERKRIDQDGAVRGADAFVISTRFIRSCSSRVALGEFIHQTLKGISTELQDRDIRAHYSQDLKGLIFRTWPTLTDSGAFHDGATQEDAYAVLNGLSGEDFLEVSLRLMKGGRLELGLAFVVISRRAVGLIPDLLSLSRKPIDVDQRIYALCTATAVAPMLGLPKLEAFAENSSLDGTRRAVVAGVIRKARSGEPISTDDFLDLEFVP